MFPTDPHNTFGSARSVQLPPLPADPTHHQVTYGRRSDETTTKSIIDLRPRVSCGATCTDGHPYAQTWCSLWTNRD
ncbi:hypothetical protein L3Q82_022743 [Scortum barcoo]|uniref:Uncharacterized protein n=1 Tax=Scortum barcoo TaxID=214431 RepID=A0ACB8WW39_9TELE|nr:hypothetical protein L3Q82_022743 [Scortum barcoo]